MFWVFAWVDIREDILVTLFPTQSLFSSQCCVFFVVSSFHRGHSDKTVQVLGGVSGGGLRTACRHLEYCMHGKYLHLISRVLHNTTKLAQTGNKVLIH